MGVIREKLLEFYKKNNEILEDIVKISQNREVGYLLTNGSFGHRPSKIETKDDIIEYIKKGALSFHISIERWIDLNVLEENTSKKELSEYRLGWDFIIDIDSKSLDLSKITARLIVDYLKEKNIKPVYIKYSGGKGLHIAIPWEIFPETVNIEKKEEIVEEETRKLFPDLARILALYIAEEIREKLKKLILLKFNEEELKNFGINNIEKFDPYEIVEIDTILISSRHLIRCLYSINEKTGNLSVPIKENYIEKLKPEDASLDNYSYEGIPYLTEDLEKRESKEFKDLIYSSFLWKINNELKSKQIQHLAEKYKNQEGIEEAEKDIEEIKKKKIEIDESLFPPCIKNILSENIEDGRKRAVFILINFLANIGWDWDKIEKYVKEWNDKLNEPLRDRYIEYQLEWHKKLYKENKRYLTPNCNNEIYYKDIGICQPDEICSLIKNPLSYPIKKIKNIKSSQDSQNS
ncbi:MAG: DNA primase small subunit domain-containing protein [Nanopusillaceae archaeon]|jgi:hypothetical protein